MAETAPRYRLVIFDAIDDPQELRDMICGVTGMHPTDVVQWLARAPGVWPQPLEEPTVRGLLDGLYEHRVAAEAWRADQFPDLSPPRTVHRAACLAEGLRIEGLRGEPTHWVPWDCVEMICAARSPPRTSSATCSKPRWPSTVVSGIRALALQKPRPDDRLGRAHRIPRDPIGEVLIVRRDPRIAFRVVENQMNYAYLGDRLQQLGGREFPGFPRRPLRAGRECLPAPLDAGLARSGAIRRSTSSPHPRPSSTTRPIACSGAGIAATARPRATADQSPAIAAGV